MSIVGWFSSHIQDLLPRECRDVINGKEKDNHVVYEPVDRVGRGGAQSATEARNDPTAYDTHVAADSNGDVVQKLTDLTNLHKQGALTIEEFSKAKRELLDNP
eukprot:COSAG02_NODE_216_length_28610_cov_57.176879_6_plen_103_part_00